MKVLSTNNLRRTAATHLSALALAGIIASMVLTVIAIWTTHERSQSVDTDGAQRATSAYPRQDGS